MRLDLGGALLTGYERLTTRAGARLLVASVCLQLVAAVVNDSLLARLPDDAETPLGTPLSEPGPLAVDLPTALLTPLGLVALAASVVLTLVTLRTFAAGDDPTDHLGNLLAPAARLFVAGVVVLSGVLVGLALFIVPGLFVLVSLVFFQVFVAVEDDPAPTALREAWALARGHRLELLALGAGVVFVVLGVAVPLSVVVSVAAGADSVAVGVAGALTGGTATVYALAVLVEAYDQLTDGEAADGGDEDEDEDEDDEFEVDTDWARTNG
jgi:hypothetical protein